MYSGSIAPIHSIPIYKVTPINALTKSKEHDILIHISQNASLELIINVNLIIF